MTTPQPYRRLYRSRDDRVIAGVAAGLAEHLRVPALMVRVLFIALLVVYGLGAMLYVAFWAVLRVVGPERTEDDGRRYRRVAGRP